MIKRNSISTVGMSTMEWLQKRHYSIGASDAGAVLGLSKWKSNLDVYFDKVDRKISSQWDMTLAMRLGIDLEPLIRQYMKVDHKMIIHQDNKIRIHPKYPFLTANLDGMVVKEKVPAEFKTMANWDGEISDTYFAQLQHQMMVTGAPYIYFVVLSLGYNKQFIVEKYDRDDEFIAKMETELIRFWKEHIEKRIPPEPKDIKQATALYGQSIPDSIKEANDTMVSKLDELRGVSAEIGILKNKESIMKTEIMNYMEEFEALTLDGTNLVTWKSSKPSMRFDYSKFKEDQPELYKKYLKETSGSRRFIIKR